MAQLVKNLTAKTGDARNTGLSPGRSPGQGIPVFHGQKTLVGLSPWGCKESEMTGHTHVRAHTHTHTGWPKTMTISTLFMQGEAVCF